jgi:serine/threonine protein kinase
VPPGPEAPTGRSNSPALNLEPGTLKLEQKVPTTPHVPDHELVRRVGQGSYGEVWLARNVMGSFRAVKVVYRASFDSDRPYDREFGGLQKFEPVSRTHVGLVSVLHMGRNTEAGYFYCVMEAADDLALGSVIAPENYQPRTLAAEMAKRGRLPLDECVEVGLALAAALGHLHSQGLVHRDIKPSNIIFVNGRPKLADIGLVTQIGTKATYVGTEGYIPPEGPGSPGADLYSLGKVLYEISMGKAPDQFPELPTRLRELPEAGSLMRLNALVLKACEPQAAKRFHNAEDLRLALVQLQQELPTAAGGRLTANGTQSNAGARVVILAPTDAAPDAELARRLAERLAAEGYSVYTDGPSQLNVEWARRIEQHLRGAHAVIPILSPVSIQSELMAYVLEVAHQASARSTHLPHLVPLSVEPCGPLPRQMALALAGAVPIANDSTDPNQLVGAVIAALSEIRSPNSEPVQGRESGANPNR